MRQRLNPTTVYYVMVGTHALCFMLFANLSTVYRVGAGLTPAQLLLVGTMLEITVFTAEVPTGIVADLVSRRLSIVIGYVIMGLGFMLEGSLSWVVTIMAAQLVWGLGYTFTSGAEEAWLADEIGEEKLTDTYLRASQISQIASLVGIALSTWIASYQLGWPMMLGGAGLLGLALFLGVAMPESKFKPAGDKERQSWGHMWHTFRQGWGLVRTSTLLLIIFVIALFDGLAYEGLDRLGFAHLLENFTLPAVGVVSGVTWFGVINALKLLLALGLTELIRRKITSQANRTTTLLLMVLYAAVVATMLIFALTHQVSIAIIAFLTLSMIRRAIQPVYRAWLNRQLPSEVRATVLSMNGQTESLGELVSGPLMAGVASFGSIRLVLTSSAMLLLPIVVLLGRAVGLSQTTKEVVSTPAD